MLPYVRWMPGVADGTQHGKSVSILAVRLPPQTAEIAISTMALPELAQLAAGRSIIAAMPLLV